MESISFGDIVCFVCDFWGQKSLKEGVLRINSFSWKPGGNNIKKEETSGIKIDDRWNVKEYECLKNGSFSTFEWKPGWIGFVMIGGMFGKWMSACKKECRFEDYNNNDISYKAVVEAIKTFRAVPSANDQYLPPFVIVDDSGKPVGPIVDGDAVVTVNFRADHMTMFGQALEYEKFDKFDRVRFLKIRFAGRFQYDGELKLPNHYLVSPPLIERTSGKYLVHNDVRTFAYSETVKFGHVTFFWNGNRSGYFNAELEEYVEIPSDSGILETWKKEFNRWQFEDIPLYDFYYRKVDNRAQQLEVLKLWANTRSILILGYKQFSTIVCDNVISSVAASCQEILLTYPSFLILDEGHTPRNKDTDVKYVIVIYFVGFKAVGESMICNISPEPEPEPGSDP